MSTASDGNSKSTNISRTQPLERKKLSKPSGKLTSANIGIKSILNPKKEISAEDQELTSQNTKSEEITFDNLARVWKEYALKVKRERMDSLYSTLINANPRLGSDLKITIDIKNSIAAREFDNNKPEFIKFLKIRLKNYAITIDYIIAESSKIEFSDNKSKFEKLVIENGSLDKFRKLFNLDIEY
jgi:hypothetical protein